MSLTTQSQVPQKALRCLQRVSEVAPTALADGAADELDAAAGALFALAVEKLANREGNPEDILPAGALKGTTSMHVTHGSVSWLAPDLARCCWQAEQPHDLGPKAFC